MDSESRDYVEHPGTPAAEPLSAVPVAVGFERKVRRRAWRSAAKVAGVYALFGSIWILLSDRLLGSLVAAATFAVFQFGPIKGLAFMLVNATVFLLGLHRALLRWLARQRAA